MKQVFLFFALTILVLIPFFIWGEAWTERFTFEGAIAWLKEYGSWAWLSGIVLLILDIVLPVPGTLVMSGLGYIYGVFWGGIFAAAGSFISGAAGYWLCRSFGRRGAEKILGRDDFARGIKTFDQVGGWLVVLSRWLPVFPEVISCMAGLNQMSKTKFHLALLCSAIPMGFIYATIGQAGVNNPILAFGLSAGLPPAIWLLVRPLFNRQKERGMKR
ncbi:MAG: TVP38/TMEM64 family protein [Saprospiraceae bacterium]|nr:TVP38/TMEM64 family protein [Saprospiraceae bacterium]